MTRSDQLAAINELLDVMDRLRAECPWDKKQTFESLSKLSIEELYELVDAIRDQDLKGIEEELGDVLLHIIFYSKLGSEVNSFDIGTVAKQQVEKLIRRHPHIYGDLTVQSEEEVKQNWEAIKLKEGRKGILSGVPKSLPAMVKAYRIQEKAKQVGFEWEKAEDVFEKVEEEIQELKESVSNHQQSEIEAEFGDVLFSLINYARFLGVDPEQALSKTNQKFKYRFEYMESQAEKNQQSLSDLSLEQKEELWQEAKNPKK